MNVFKLVALCSAIGIFMGCSSKPSKSESKQIGYQYLVEMVPGIKKDEIEVLKTFIKEESPVVVIQAGGMICEMPMLKGKDGWIARGISCNGQFETPEKSAQRKKEVFRESVVSFVEKENKTYPAKLDNGSVMKKATLINDSLVYEVSYPEIKVADISKKTMDEAMAADAKVVKENLCSNKTFSKMLNNGYSIEFKWYDADNVSIGNVVTKLADCG